MELSFRRGFLRELGIALGIALGAGVASTMQKKGAKKNQISDEAAEAMVSKMKFEAEQHRKKRDRYNYIKMTGEEEE